MKLQISSIADKGTSNRERLVLKVLTEADVGDFILMQTGFTESDGVTNNVYNAYWFPYKRVSSGDLVVVYTKSGTESQKSIDGNRIVHFFYWGLASPIWTKKHTAAVLLYAPEWESKNADKL
jgi:hypothetical protein